MFAGSSPSAPMEYDGQSPPPPPPPLALPTGAATPPQGSPRAPSPQPASPRASQQQPQQQRPPPPTSASALASAASVPQRRLTATKSMRDLREDMGFTDDQIAILLRHFDQLDLNGDGHITAQELFLMFKALKVPVAPDTLNKLISDADKDHNGTIEFSEFVAMVASLRSKDNEAWIMLLKSTRPSAIQRFQANAARFVGVVDPETERKRATELRKKSFFQRKDNDPKKAPERERDALTRRIVKSNSFRVLSSAVSGNKRRAPNDVEMAQRGGKPEDGNGAYDATHDENVIKQLAQKETNWTPWFLLVVTLIQIVLMVIVIIQSNGIQNMAINYMAGPSSLALLRIGARYSPCMRPNSTAIETTPFINCAVGFFNCQGIPDTDWINGTFVPYYTYLANLCGGGGFPSGQPDQWWRFISPIFLNAGLIQLGINVFITGYRGFMIEQEIGPLRMAIVYLGGGIFGVALGANNTPNNIAVASTACMFSFLGLLYLDLFMNWPLIVKPWLDLIVLLVVTIIALAFGLLPYIDLFQSLGTLTCGILLGIIFVPHLNFGYWDSVRKKIAIAVAVPCVLVMYFLVFWFFYRVPGYDCNWCTIVSTTFNV